MPKRPSFILSASDVPEEAGKYPDSEELMSYGRAIGRAAGLERIGLHLERLPAGHRTSYPHAEEKEEEFVFVVSGTVDAWIDGERHAMTAGDLAAFPAGTGIAHTFINDSDAEAVLLVGGERTKPDNRIDYPLNESVLLFKDPAMRWTDRPRRPLGSASAVPKKR